MRSLACVAYDLYGCFLNQRRAKPYHRTHVVAPLIQTLKIRSPTCLTEARLRLEVLRVLRKLKYKLSRKDYLQINVLPNLVVVEREEYPHALQRKATGGGATGKVVKRRLAGRGQA